MPPKGPLGTRLNTIACSLRGEDAGSPPCQSQFSTEPVNEQEVEAFLRQAYHVAGLAPPRRIQWVDSSPHLVAVLAAQSDLDEQGVGPLLGATRGERDRQLWSFHQ